MQEIKSQICKRCFVEKDIGQFFLNPKTNNYWGVCLSCKRRPPSKILEREFSKSLRLEEKRIVTDVKACLSCDKEFHSVSKFNRLCENCRRVEW